MNRSDARLVAGVQRLRLTSARVRSRPPRAARPHSATWLDPADKRQICR
jgi:plasmid replication initiation protein